MSPSPDTPRIPHRREAVPGRPGRRRHARAGAVELAGILAAALAVSACTSGPSEPGPTTPAASSTSPAPTPTSTDPDGTTTETSTTGTGTTEAGATGTSATETSTTGTTGEPTSSPTTGSVPLPTEFLTVERSIRDPELGHEIVVSKIARNLAWPPGFRGQELAFELVGVEMRWTPGAAYTAPLRALDFTVVTTSAFPNRPDRLLEPTFVAAGWTVLPESFPVGQSVTGWMVFKVDPKGAVPLRLDYTRPAMRVTNAGGTTFPKKVFSIDLTTPPTAPGTAPATPTP